MNGGEIEAPAGETVEGLLARLGLDRGPVAVERNGEIVPRGRRAETVLAEGDRLEILRFVGGGAGPARRVRRRRRGPSRLALLEALARTWRAFQSATDVEGILGAALEGIASVEAPRAAHALLAEAGHLRVRASLGRPPAAVTLSIGDAHSVCAAAFRDAAPAAGAAVAERRAGLVAGPARAYPLSGGRVHGVLLVEPRRGGGDAPAWPRDISTSAGLALDTAVLYGDLVEALHHISLLSSAARRMQEGDPESLVDRALVPVAERLGWPVLALYADSGARLGGLGGPERLPAALAARTGADAPRFIERTPPHGSPLGGVPVAAVPVRFDPDRGLLVASAGGAGEITPGRVDLLVALADRLGLALRDARLVSEVRAHSVAVEYLNRELARTVEDLRRSNDLKSRFVSTVSHELRTPLASIRLHAETILDSLDEIDRDRIREFTTVIAQETERLSRLIGEILDLSRLLSGRRPLLRRPVDLSEAAERVAGTLRPIAEAKGVVIEVRAAAGAVVSADRDGAIQALTNVLGNAVKYTPSGGRVSVEVRPDETDVSVAVADTGAGIPPDHLPHVFEEFYKVDTTGSEEGTGLGLAITKAIVEGHGGRIDVESEVGRGTTFTLRFPRGA